MINKNCTKEIKDDSNFMLADTNTRILNETGKMAKIGGWEHDLKTQEAFWTEALYDIIEIDYSKPVPGVNEHMSYYPPKDREILQQAYQKAVDEHTPFDLELQVNTAKGNPIWCRIYGEPVIENGITVKMRGTFQDITKQKETQIALQQSERTLSNLIANMQGIIYRCRNDKNWTFDFMSEGIVDLTGYSVEDILYNRTISFNEIIYPDDRQMVWELTQKAIEQKQPFQFEYRIKTITDQIKWVWEKGSGVFDNDGNLLFIEGFIVEITENKKALMALKESGIRFRELFDNMSSGVAIYEAVENGKDFIFKDINKAGQKLSKVKKEQIIGKKVTKIFPEIKDFGLFEVFQNVYKTAIPQRLPISQYKDNRIAQWAENYVYKLPSGQIVAVYDDITKEKLAEEMTRQSEERFRLAMDAATNGLWDWDITTGDVYYSPAWAKILEEDKPLEPYSNIWEARLHPQDKDDALKKLQKHLDGNSPIWKHEFRLRTKQGDYKWVLGTGKVVERANDAKPLRMLGTIKDISERKEWEKDRGKYQEKLKLMAFQQMEQQDQQKRKLAAALHDSIGQKLALAKMELLEIKSENNQHKLDPATEKLREQFNEIIEEVRSLTYEMSDPVLYELGLGPAIENVLQENLKNKYNINYKLNITDKNLQLNEKLKTTLFRSTREILVNIIKHAKANMVTVDIQRNNGNCSIIIEDNGIGFEPEKTFRQNHTSGGFGLFSINEQLTLLGGKMNIESKNKDGTKVILSVPINIGN